MSKVDTLLKLIAYQQQHPQASDKQIAQEIGISLGYVYNGPQYSGQELSKN